MPDLPTVALDSGYIESRGAEAGCPERELWRAVLRQAADDLFDSNERIRADAIAFFQSSDLPLILDYAGLGRDCAPLVKTHALELASASQATPTGPGNRITYKGQTRTLTQWAEITGVNVTTLCHRLRRGWSIEEALTVPNQKRTATAA